jgi:hypothetical protein
MPQWLSVLIGLVAGLAIVAAAIFVAVRPYVSAKPPKPRMPDQADNQENLHASQWLGSGPFNGDGRGPNNLS